MTVGVKWKVEQTSMSISSYVSSLLLLLSCHDLPSSHFLSRPDILDNEISTICLSYISGMKHHSTVVTSSVNLSGIEEGRKNNYLFYVYSSGQGRDHSLLTHPRSNVKTQRLEQPSCTHCVGQYYATASKSRLLLIYLYHFSVSGLIFMDL